MAFSICKTQLRTRLREHLPMPERESQPGQEIAQLILHSLADCCVQDDPSGSSEPPVDIKTKVAFQYMLFALNVTLDVNRRFGTT